MLTSVDRVKSLMPESEGLSDLEIEFLIKAASQSVEDYCKRSFKRRVYRETLDGPGSNYLVLRNFPVFGGTARVGEQEVPILPNDDGLIFSSHGWPAGQRNIEVEYEAGYTLPGEETSEQPRTLPEVVEMACMFTMQGMLSQPAGNIQSERVGDVSVTYRDVDAALPLTARNLLVPYVGRWV